MLRTRLSAVLLSVMLVTLLGAASLVSAQSPVEIQFWHAMSGNNGQAVTDLVAAYNASQSDVVVIEQSKGGYQDTLNAVIQAAGAGEGPNIAMIFDLGTPLAIDSGFFLPLEDALTPEQLEHVKGDVMAPLINYFTIGGKLHSLPWNNSTPLYYYNKDMFAAAGLDPEVPPTTWQEIEETCATLMEAQVAPYCISMQVYGWYHEQWMALQGQELVDNGNGRADRATETNLTSDASRAIVEWWDRLNDAGYWVYTGKLHDNQGANQIFNAQQAAMIVESTGAMRGFLTAAEEGGYELGAGFFPANADVDREGVIIGGASLWLGAGQPQEELDASVDFLMWLHEPEQMAVWHQRTGYMPITLSSQELLDSQGYFDENPLLRTAVDQLAAGAVTPATAGAIMGPFPQIREIVETAIQNVTNGEDIDAMLENAKAEADALIADYNSRLQ